jgi:hypothetical protein
MGGRSYQSGMAGLLVTLSGPETGSENEMTAFNSLPRQPTRAPRVRR